MARQRVRLVGPGEPRGQEEWALAVQASEVQEEVGQEAQAEVGAALMVGAARGW